ncbi:hypothetical protein BO85DRAFT_106677 [Aspergillus piperis CBS 112811]|uniref:Uncharacterized protein n=1 Tax=Aspergillus piperis CBS 112811 TaxID=1448313 RepID=A0A8G1RBR6_9EURO|nr:hypothetical protein BO85DRAFT_106677 [Aspergillus piperis CBS 112811]RAH61515.1 hypothetical protein BO85DRAFT_106677 [Aspergillus piperis CBS 112811]
MSIETRLSSAPESICQELELRTGVTSVNDSNGMKAGGKGPTSPSASLPGPVHKYLVCRPSVRSSYKSRIDPRALCTGGVRCKEQAANRHLQQAALERQPATTLPGVGPLSSLLTASVTSSARPDHLAGKHSARGIVIGVPAADRPRGPGLRRCDRSTTKWELSRS